MHGMLGALCARDSWWARKAPSSASSLVTSRTLGQSVDADWSGKMWAKRTPRLVGRPPVRALSGFCPLRTLEEKMTTGSRMLILRAAALS